MSTNAEKINEIVARMDKWRREFSDVDKRLAAARANRGELIEKLEAAQTLYDELEEKANELDNEIGDLKSELDDLWDAATNDLEDEPKEKTPAKKKGKK